MKKIKLNIEGLHCKSCEILLERELKKIEGIKTCNVSHKKGVCEIESAKDIPLGKIVEVVEKTGYQVVMENENHQPGKEKRISLTDFIQIVFIAIGVFSAVYLLKELEITRYFPNFGGNVNVYIALILGVVASMSTCLAIVGGIVLSFSELYPVRNDSKHIFLSRALPHIYFHIGRIFGFAFLGGILGLIGSKINYSLSFTGYLTVVIAVLMFYIGLQILNIVPNITKLGFHLPKSLSNLVQKAEKTDNHLAPILIGALTFFLPCGFTQSMQLAAVTSGNFAVGAFIMAAFALGTMPVLIAVGIGSTYAKKEKIGFLNKLIGVIIIFFAIYSLNSGLILSGSGFQLFRTGGGGNIVTSEISDKVQIVKMDVDYVFKPNEFKIKKGIPVRWEINGINVTGCSNEVVIPKLNIRQKLKEGLNVIEFVPEEEGIIPFSCWMGMLTGRFVVTK